MKRDGASRVPFDLTTELRTSHGHDDIKQIFLVSLVVCGSHGSCRTPARNGPRAMARAHFFDRARADQPKPVSVERLPFQEQD